MCDNGMLGLPGAGSAMWVAGMLRRASREAAVRRECLGDFGGASGAGLALPG